MGATHEVPQRHGGLTTRAQGAASSRRRGASTAWGSMARGVRGVDGGEAWWRRLDGAVMGGNGETGLVEVVRLG
jgi:hypothetical protein